MKKISLAFLLLLFLVSLGTFGYIYIEGFSFLESLYMTVITISTVGFQELRPLSWQGKLFTIFLIIGSVGIFAYAVTIIGNFLIEGHLTFISRRKKMQKQLEFLKKHYIICGINRVAKEAIKEFKKAGVDFIVVAERIEEEKEELFKDILFLEGDPTSDETLQKIKITQAEGLLSCLDSDKENLFVVISARNLNPQLKIITLVKEEESISKFLKAGADNVILPEVIGGRRMASIALRPQVLSFLDVMTTTAQEGLSLKLEEVNVPKKSVLANLSLAEAKIPQKTGLLVVAIKKASGFLYNPSSSTQIEPQDTLIVLGTEEQIKRLRELISS
ncbi:MAG TPA: potassium channel protein [Candidatus Omnitrophica bacterium]|nr:MAG: potassium channel protein [Candidatus Omnitrophota bacterium]RKY44914.1 MAG: potassium channel protein [Candidatus Omnitrophota bacterium]HEC68819.1 potassium channel protein [Candidatus Omnitrophota bacterium]